MTNWYLIYAYALGVSFASSLLLTEWMRRLAIRLGVLDHPGERKMQKAPVPLLGGAAIFITFCAVVTGSLLLLKPVRMFGTDWLHMHVFSFLGDEANRKLLGIFVGGVVIFVLGIIDDIKVLRPEPKLIGELIAALAVVLGGVRLDLFIPDVWDAHWASVFVTGSITIIWIVLMTNAMNFLDNMDGLCAGITAIAAVAMFASLVPDDTFVCLLLVVLAGAAVGFLYHNMNPAKIYMGDSGALFCGYVLAVASVLATFYTSESHSRTAILAPLAALSVPLFDTASVVFIRWRGRESIMKGDKRHFSHRLVTMGMTPRQAVEFIYLVGVVSGMGAVLLRQVDLWGAVVILVQIVGVFGLIVLLMSVNHAGKKGS